MVTKSYELEQINEVILVKLNVQELSVDDMQEIVTELTHRMLYENVIYFVLDMSPIGFMDSACLGELVTFRQYLEHARGRIALANCKKNVSSLFEVTGLHTVFKLFDSTDSACEQLPQAA